MNQVKECLEEIIKSSSVNFVESVDVAVNLNVDSRKSEEHVRGMVVLPNGIGRNIKVAVLTGDKRYLLEANESCADVIGGEDLVEKIKNGRERLDVDWCITTPDFMVKITPIARVLGAKGLMPNPKFGTLTFKVAETIKIIKSGQIRFRTDKNGIIHSKIGNTKFNIDSLLGNLKAFLTVVKNNKPSSISGVYFKSVFLNSTMGRAYKINKIDDIV